MVVCENIIIVSMETGAEVVILMVGDNDIDETMDTLVVNSMTLLELSINVLNVVLTAVLLKTGLPVIAMLSIELIPLFGVGIPSKEVPSTVIVSSKLKVLEVLVSTGENVSTDEGVKLNFGDEVVIMAGSGVMVTPIGEGIGEGTRLGSNVLDTVIRSKPTMVGLPSIDMEVENKGLIKEFDLDGKIELAE